MTTRRPIPIEIRRATGATITVPPLTRAQIGRVYALGDLPAGAGARAEFGYRGALLEIYLEHAQCMDAAGAVQSPEAAIADLFPEEEVDIIQAIVAAQHGHNPEDVVALGQAMRAVVKKKLRREAPPISSPPTTGKRATSRSSSKSRPST